MKRKITINYRIRKLNLIIRHSFNSSDPQGVRPHGVIRRKLFQLLVGENRPIFSWGRPNPDKSIVLP